MCKLWTENAFIGQKYAKKGQKMGEKCIYSRNLGQKGAKNGHFFDAKRIYREKCGPLRTLFRPRKAYIGKKLGQKVQKTINFLPKNAYIVENMDKFVQKTIKNAYIGGKCAKNGQISGQKRIYSTKIGQK